MKLAGVAVCRLRAGPAGQKRPDLPRGEALLAGALDALEKSVAS